MPQVSEYSWSFALFMFFFSLTSVILLLSSYCLGGFNYYKQIIIKLSIFNFLV